MKTHKRSQLHANPHRAYGVCWIGAVENRAYEDENAGVGARCKRASWVCAVGNRAYGVPWIGAVKNRAYGDENAAVGALCKRASLEARLETAPTGEKNLDCGL